VVVEVATRPVRQITLAVKAFLAVAMEEPDSATRRQICGLVAVEVALVVMEETHQARRAATAALAFLAR
jgi:hypothetical protein